MKVLHVYRTFFPDSQGGLEEAIRQICVSTKGQGIESRVLSLSRNPHPAVLDISGIQVHRAQLTADPLSCSISLQAISAHRKLLDWCDVVHYHHPWPFADVLYAASQRNKPAVLTYHSDIVRQRLLGALYAPFLEQFLRRMDCIVATSPNYLSTSPTLSKVRGRVEVVPYGLIEHTYPAADRDQLQQTERRFGSEFFLFVGVLRYYKGLKVLLRALQDTRLPVVIAGSGPVEQELHALARQLDLAHVQFAGRVTDEEKVALFSLCKGVVFPSHLRSEAFGITLLEGAMYGKPLISTEVGTGTSHVNIDGQTGLVVEPNSESELRAALEQLDGDPQLRERLGNGARARFEAHFTGAEMGRRYAAIYHSLESAQKHATGKL